MMFARRLVPAIAFLSAAAFSFAAARAAETVTLATYNIEHFQKHFYAHELTKKLPKPVTDPDVKEMLAELRSANDEDNWEVAQVISDKRFNPDVLVIEEGCDQSNLDYFNKRWLRGAYETAVVFPTNTGDRNQHLAMLLKPGFKIVERRDKYHEEKDSIANERGGLLFARGPAFCLIETPSGYRFWVGVTHQKSKYIGFDNDDKKEAEREAVAGNPAASKEDKGVAVKEAKLKASRDASAWRSREAVRTHEIMKELAKAGPEDVVILGDMNDELGEDESEKGAGGGDSIAHLIGAPADGFVLITQPLVDKKEISFGGYFRPDYRSFIDHVVATGTMRDQIQDVQVFDTPLARVASDHFPVMVKVRSDPPKPGATTLPAK